MQNQIRSDQILFAILTGILWILALMTYNILLLNRKRSVLKILEHLLYGICVKRGHVAQSDMCVVTGTWLTADPGVLSLILAPSRALVEIDHEIISMVILFSSADPFKKGYCQLQAKVCAPSTG